MGAENSVRLFISHASEDEHLAGAVVRLLRSALMLPQDAIRCTSLDGCRLPAGADTDEQIRSEIVGATVVLGIISHASLASPYVLFELGARWGTAKPFMLLIRPGVDPSAIQGPLSGKNVLRSNSAGQVHQLVAEIGHALGVVPSRPDAYQADLETVITQPPVQSRRGDDLRHTLPTSYVLRHGIVWGPDGTAYCEGCRTGSGVLVSPSLSGDERPHFVCPHGHPPVSARFAQGPETSRHLTAGIFAQGGAGAPAIQAQGGPGGDGIRIVNVHGATGGTPQERH